jgi:hypothetical protein
MVVRIRLSIDQEMYSALSQLALSEERSPEGQLRYMLRDELIRRGLLHEDSTSCIVAEYPMTESVKRSDVHD